MRCRSCSPAGAAGHAHRSCPRLFRPVPEGRRACGLYLSLMNRMGASMTRFGDADRPLAEL